MKIVPSVLVGNLSGSSGGTTCANWKGRLYGRRRVIPHNPKSDAQILQRGYMARMATWYRSLPETITDKLKELGTPLRMSGFNVMTKEDLRDLALLEPPEIIPKNPKNIALFSAASTAPPATQTVGVDFVAGEADPTHYVAALTCPVTPDEVDKEEPDGWTLAATPVLVSAGTYIAIAVDNEAKNYWVVLIVIDTATLVEATKISGGTSCIAISGTVP